MKLKNSTTRTARKRMGRRLVIAAAAVVLPAIAIGYTLRSEAQEVMSVAEIGSKTHVHGLAVDPQDSSLLIATHHGLFRATDDGRAERISAVKDFMGFSIHPSDPNVLFASGHPAGGGNLGFITSSDGGRTWEQVSEGANGPVDFHQMTVSPADPKRIYGSYGGLQVSRDGGSSFETVAQAPEGLIGLSASAQDADRLYAATEAGLLMSGDAGKTWEPLMDGAPVSVVEVTPEGSLYAFGIGRGLLKANEPPVALQSVSNDFGEDYLLHLAVDPQQPERLFASTSKGALIASTDGGTTWAPLE